MARREPASEWASGRFMVPPTFAKEIEVLVIGCGGSGSEMVDALVRFHHSARGIGHPGLSLTLQDGDVVSATNVGRARFLPSDVGHNKAQLLARRYGLLFAMNIKSIPTECSRSGIERMGHQYDLVITCVDKASFRVRMADYWRSLSTDTLWLDLGNGDYTGQSVLGTLGEATMPRLPNVLDLFPAVRTTRDDAAPSCSMAEALKSQSLFVNRFIVDTAVAMLWQLLAEGFITCHGAISDMRSLQVKPIAVNPGTWKIFGFQPAELRSAA